MALDEDRRSLAGTFADSSRDKIGDRAHGVGKREDRQHEQELAQRAPPLAWRNRLGPLRGRWTSGLGDR